MEPKKLTILDYYTLVHSEEEADPVEGNLLVFNNVLNLRTGIHVWEDSPKTIPEDLIYHIGDAELVLTNKVPMTREVIEACPNLEYIGVLATGYNNVDLQAAAERGIPVCNAGQYSTDSVAQLVFSYILDHYQKPALYFDLVKDGLWENSFGFTCYHPFYTSELRGKTLGIIGLGAIGKRVAEIASVFGMNVIAATRTYPENCPYQLMSVDEVFEKADIVTLHCPLTWQTKHLVNKERLAHMKEGAVLINTSRGGTVCEQDLADALNSGRLSEAYLDVLDTEPMSPDTPLKTAKNCHMTPHIAWATIEARKRLIDISAANILAWYDGKPQNVVNADLLRQFGK